MLKHVGYDSAKQLAADFEAGVCVDFYEPDIELLIDHEIQPEDLKVVLEIIGIQLEISGLDCIGSDGFHLGVDMIGKAAPAFAILLVQVSLELVVG